MNYKKYLIQEQKTKVVWSNDGWWGKGYLVKTNKKYAWVKDLSGDIIKVLKNLVAYGWVDTYDEIDYHITNNKIKE